jgi:hypothetical protein
VDQYLLLDYPGENDFLAALLPELRIGGASTKPPLIVSYNGKTFDTQILKTRCLMNGIVPPEYYHADLLHPARRLWKRLLPSCSQGDIETASLGLDRTGDISGAMAPDIWFSFLKTGETGPLRGICDHNLKDIYGLSRLLLALAAIAAAPLEHLQTYPYDPENLALHWRRICRRNPDFFGEPWFDENERVLGSVLLNEAAGRGYPRALLALAIEAEWHQRDPVKALALVESALAGEIAAGLREELLFRRERLRGKTEKMRGR